MYFFIWFSGFPDIWFSKMHIVHMVFCSFRSENAKTIWKIAISGHLVDGHLAEGWGKILLIWTWMSGCLAGITIDLGPKDGTQGSPVLASSGVQDPPKFDKKITWPPLCGWSGIWLIYIYIYFFCWFFGFVLKIIVVFLLVVFGSFSIFLTPEYEYPYQKHRF